MDLLEEGWVRVPSPPDWEGFTIDVRADLVSGEPRVVGIRVEPLPDAAPADVVLTVNRLRTLPVSRWGALAYHAVHLTPGSVSDLIAAVDAEQGASAGRRATDAETVAKVYAAARLQGRSDPRQAVCEALSISSRTADRYISEARRTGILAAYDERKSDR